MQNRRVTLPEACRIPSAIIPYARRGKVPLPEPKAAGALRNANDDLRYTQPFGRSYASYEKGKRDEGLATKESPEQVTTVFRPRFSRADLQPRVPGAANPGQLEGVSRGPRQLALFACEADQY